MTHSAIQLLYTIASSLKSERYHPTKYSRMPFKLCSLLCWPQTSSASGHVEQSLVSFTKDEVLNVPIDVIHKFESSSPESSAEIAGKYAHQRFVTSAPRNRTFPSVVPSTRS
jgi:hypothetical protein